LQGLLESCNVMLLERRFHINVKRSNAMVVQSMFGSLY
jgi:hypothetical protein